MVCNKLDQPILSYGVMGGQYQPVGQTHILNNIFDYGMNPQEAISFPRAFHFNDVYQLESGIDDKIENDLKKKDTKQFVTTCIMGVLKQFKLIGKKDH